MTVEDTPTVSRKDVIDPEMAERTKAFTGSVLKKFYRQKKTGAITIIAPENDLNSLMAVASRGIKRFGGHAEITQEKLSAFLTFSLPNNPVGNFVNIHFDIYPSISGLHISPVSIGRIKIPGRTSLFIIRYLLDLILGNENGTVIVNSVRTVSIDQNAVIFSLSPIPDIMERQEKILSRFRDLRESMPLLSLSNPETVRIYSGKLAELDDRLVKGQSISLAYFMGPLFELATQRSYNNDPVLENKAALLALAVYLGDSRFEKLIGSGHGNGKIRRKSSYRRVLLGGRADLRLHFVISAGMKIVSDSGITAAAGEFKELLDARRGGSGFSFADLAADLAGKRLAETATDSARARNVQAVLAGTVSETLFFPDIHDLPEELSREQFEHKYINVEDPRYTSFVTMIEKRISRLPAYMGYSE
ncbi:MAG: hypothetical protein C4538_01270 [Nitrospiraceae bacterium]|nr:MAG: hypothetical protein C4538_01270 [Nitrospiraceae bacterium]